MKIISENKLINSNYKKRENCSLVLLKQEEGDRAQPLKNDIA